MSNPKQPIKIIFLGTPEFSVPALKILSQDKRFEIISVISQLDKKIGRQQILTSPPVKIEALKLKLTVLQPQKISELENKLKKLKPQAAVLIAYGQIIPEKILNIPKHGFINIHASLLPKYRGASCLQAPILNGDLETGITIMKMDKGLDTGPIIKQNKIKISRTETATSLHDKLSKLGAEILPDVLFDFIQGKINPKPQDDKQASYVPRLTKQDGLIDWKKKAKEIERMARALNPWPGTFGQFQISNFKFQIKFLEVSNKILRLNKYKSGEFFEYMGELAIQCGKDSLIIESIQPEGKKPMTGKEFIRGYQNILSC